MSRKGRGHKQDQQHVRMHLFEMKLPAYTTLSCNARALLVELRSFYSGRENEVFLSIRDMQQRLNLSQKPAQKARDELLKRGWIVEVEKGSFSRKGGRATVYALTNWPLGGFDRGIAPKPYLKWQPGMDFANCMVGDSTAPSSQIAYTRACERRPSAANGSQNAYRQPKNPRAAVGETDTQVDVPPGEASGGVRFKAFDGLSASASASASGAKSGCGQTLSGSNWQGDASIAAGAAQPAHAAAGSLLAGHSERRSVGHTIACKCGGRTHRKDAKAGPATLAWQECGCCGRADRHQMDDGAGNTLIGEAAKARFASVEQEAHAAESRAALKVIGRGR